MAEAGAFIAGLITMGTVWFITDIHPKTSPYARGLKEGFEIAKKAYCKESEEEDG